jgi:hypothetical protein
MTYWMTAALNILTVLADDCASSEVTPVGVHTWRVGQREATVHQNGTSESDG